MSQLARHGGLVKVSRRYAVPAFAWEDARAVRTPTSRMWAAFVDGRQCCATWAQSRGFFGVRAG